MPFEGVPQTEKVPSSMLAPTMRRGPAVEVKHPKTFEELAKESEERNRRATAVTEHSQASNVGEEWEEDVVTERPISPFQELKEEERHEKAEQLYRIQKRFEQEGYDEKAAMGLAMQELERLQVEKEVREQEEFIARDREKMAKKLEERKAAEAAYVAEREARLAQVRARQATGNRVLPPYSIDDHQAA